MDYGQRMAVQRQEHQLQTAQGQARDAAYWRKSYEDLVKQTGRDLNDGLGIDPRTKGR